MTATASNKISVNRAPALTLWAAVVAERLGFDHEELDENALAYAITIHKSQGSEFGAVIIPVLTQHFKMLYRNLVYTGLTRARNLAVFVGTRKALAMAVKNQDTSQRQTFLRKLLS